MPDPRVKTPYRRKTSRGRKVRRVILFMLLLLLIIPFLYAIGMYVYFSYDLPRLTSVKDYAPNIVSQVLSENGEVIAEFFTEKRYFIPIEEMPTTLIQAFIAAEDSRFLEHQGIDLTSILRALIKNILPPIIRYISDAHYSTFGIAFLLK